MEWKVIFKGSEREGREGRDESKVGEGAKCIGGRLAGRRRHSLHEQYILIMALLNRLLVYWTMTIRLE